MAAIGATLPGAAWQRCRTHYATNLMAITPKSSWPWVRTVLHSVFDQPDAESVAESLQAVFDSMIHPRFWELARKQPGRTKDLVKQEQQNLKNKDAPGKNATPRPEDSQIQTAYDHQEKQIDTVIKEHLAKADISD